jgi:flagellar motor protein MotB
MKKIIFILLVCVAQIATAQKFTIENDSKILENGVLVAKYEKTSATYTVITSMDEDEMISIEQTTDEELNISYLVISFSDASQSQAYLPVAKKNVNVIDALLKAKVIKGGILNAEVINQFCAKNTMENLIKKPLAKQAKADAKTEKAETKAEKDEDKEFEKEEKTAAKEMKKETAKEEKVIKKEIAKDEKLEKKEDKLADKNVNAKPDKKANGDLDEASDTELVFKNGMIINHRKTIGLYNIIESMVKGKKGKVMTIYSTDKKRLAVIKYNSAIEDAEITSGKKNELTPIQFYTNTEENKQKEIIFKLLEMKIL